MYQRGDRSSPLASRLHRLKSMGFPQPAHLCGRSNSSEKISTSLAHSGHLQTKELKFRSLSNPGQCIGLLVSCGMINLPCGFLLSPAFAGRSLAPCSFGSPIEGRITDQRHANRGMAHHSQVTVVIARTAAEIQMSRTAPGELKVPAGRGGMDQDLVERVDHVQRIQDTCKCVGTPV